MKETRKAKTAQGQLTPRNVRVFRGPRVASNKFQTVRLTLHKLHYNYHDDQQQQHYDHFSIKF